MHLWKHFSPFIFSIFIILFVYIIVIAAIVSPPPHSSSCHSFSSCLRDRVPPSRSHTYLGSLSWGLSTSFPTKSWPGRPLLYLCQDAQTDCVWCSALTFTTMVRLYCFSLFQAPSICVCPPMFYNGLLMMQAMIFYLHSNIFINTQNSHPPVVLKDPCYCEGILVNEYLYKKMYLLMYHLGDVPSRRWFFWDFI